MPNVLLDRLLFVCKGPLAQLAVVIVVEIETLSEEILASS
jgi:hypothetical protein